MGGHGYSSSFVCLFVTHGSTQTPPWRCVYSKAFTQQVSFIIIVADFGVKAKKLEITHWLHG